MRPAALSADDTPHLPVMQHAVAWMRDQQRYEPDWVMILMPTSPLRQPLHIVESVALAVASRRGFGGQRRRDAGALSIRCAR